MRAKFCAVSQTLTFQPIRQGGSSKGPLPFAFLIFTHAQPRSHPVAKTYRDYNDSTQHSLEILEEVSMSN